MTVKQKYDSELSNVGRIVVYKEGLFWKAYERSAYLLSLRGADYQVNWENSKDCVEGVVSVGFHEKSLEAYKGCLHVIDETPVRVILDSGMAVAEAAFLQWKEERLAKAQARAKARPAKRRIIEDPAMHAALAEAARQEASGAMAAETKPVAAVRPSGEDEFVRWAKDFHRRILSFNIASSSVVGCASFLSSIQSEIIRYGETKKDEVPSR